MLFYTQNDDPEWREAMIHNIDTGITYKLELQSFNGIKMPVVEMITPQATALHGKRLFKGEQAVEFWRALLFRNPWAGSPVSPRQFLDNLVGVGESKPENEGPF